ncbi:sensor histidine kinase [Ramlibacter humi]|nr:HAMP domain-containing sensor histidine kinase [Ramlibacter humi]
MQPEHFVNELPAEVEALRREVERLSRRIDRGNGLLDAILSESPHGILVCDRDGKLTLHNRAAESIWAGSATTHGVQDWSRYRAFHQDGRPFAPEDWSMARCLREGVTIQAEEVRIQKFDGSHGMLLGSCAPIRDAGGAVEGAISVFADITRFKQVERLRDQWVAMAGHELRSPLQVLQNQLHAALRSRRPVDLEQLIPSCIAQVRRMSHLVEDMLDVSRAQAGSLRVNVESVDLKSLILKVGGDILAPAAQHVPLYELDDVFAMADAGRTEQVLANLLTNAVRYSPQGGPIRVRLRALQTHAEIVVEDQGIGFDPQIAETLFEPFLQVQPDTRRGTGLGLGLHLARELVTRMGGSIAAKSEGPGSGAVFTFQLPLGPRPA